MNFVNTILLSVLNSDRITIFSTLSGTKIKSEFLDFYKEHHVEIIGNETYSKNKVRQIRSAMTMLLKTILLKKHLKKEKHYDYCFVLYVSWQAAEWMRLTKKYFSHIIPVFLGGDVLRSKKISGKRFQKGLSCAEHIILPNINAKEVFSQKTNEMFDEKIHVIQYPKKMVNVFLDAEKTFDKESTRSKFGLPQDKIVVLCGHDATRAERYEEMIEALNLCKKETLEKCFFVFMMTYAPEEYHTYQEKVEDLIKDGKISGTVMKDYIAYSDILHLHMACDVHITTILTDAFSCFLQEEMLAGNILIYGKWLNYFEIENGSFYALAVDEISDVTEKMDCVCDHFEEHKISSEKNKQGIISIASEESIQKSWITEIFNK